MNIRKILIVEDNPIIAEDLAGYMQEFGYLALPSEDNATDALTSIKLQRPDLILLDVGLEGEIDGIQLAGIIKEKYDIPFIFLTAFYDNQTIERIKATRPNGYLVKPIDEHSLKTSIEVALYNFEHNETSLQSSDAQPETKFDNNDHFYIKVKQGLVKIRYEDILFFEAYDNYSYVQTTENKHLISFTLKYIESKVSHSYFLRAHRSFIINVKRITGIEDDNVILGEHKIPMGKTFRMDIMKHVNLL